MAKEIAENLKSKKKISGYEIIQFHASISYEDFVEGITPDTNAKNLVFKTHKGSLLENIERAQKNENIGYLLIIDEINRGDLAKILGEAINLFEPNEQRTITLKSGRKVTMPSNFYLIGTMNTADRTIAILDYAIRRRFAFIDVWPYKKQLEKIMIKHKANNHTIKSLYYYQILQSIFFKYATEEELHLQPGHTYFIASSKDVLKNKLKYEIVPLLKEYLAEGRLAIAKNEITALIKEIQQL